MGLCIGKRATNSTGERKGQEAFLKEMAHQLLLERLEKAREGLEGRGNGVKNHGGETIRSHNLYYAGYTVWAIGDENWRWMCWAGPCCGACMSI